ncbi:SRPBCC family protein [Candidatus Leptofilum sp.]|uniref:SRPBCC family protein n=1 Tax=Candidatus Leptofilum sp. TaxID=3241576 RepID=UPI003B5B82A6
MSEQTASKDAVVVERIFEAPIDLVWQMWASAEHFKQWYGPHGFSIPVAKMDVQVGGKRLVCMEMQTPDGSRQMWTTGEYLEVVPTTRLVYTDSMADADGNVLSPAAMGMPEGTPETTQVTVVLEDLNGRTKMTMTHAGVPADSPGASGWNQAFEKLAAYIESSQA